MKITAGKYGRRTLHVPKGRDIRPTTDKVRQAIFNILGSMGLPQEAVVIDGFCGTGALGLEALSRDARFCIFFDKSRESLQLCRRNVEMLHAGHQARLIHRNVLRPGPRPDDVPPADLIFLDPPYRQNLVKPALSALTADGWVAPGAVVVAETEKDGPVEAPEGYQLLDSRLYGECQIQIFENLQPA